MFQKLSMMSVRIIVYFAAACGSASPFNQPRRGERAGLEDWIEVFHLVRPRSFFAASHLPLQLAPCPRRVILRVRVSPGFKCAISLPRFLTGSFALYFCNDVADLQSRVLGFAARRHCADGHRSVKIPRGQKAGIGNRNAFLFHAKSNAAQKVIPWNLFRAGNIFLEERSEIGVAHGFRGLAHAVRVVKVAASSSRNSRSSIAELRAAKPAHGWHRAQRDRA